MFVSAAVDFHRATAVSRYARHPERAFSFGEVAASIYTVGARLISLPPRGDRPGASPHPRVA